MPDLPDLEPKSGASVFAGDGSDNDDDDDDDMIITSDEERHLINEEDDDAEDMKDEMTGELEVYRLVLLQCLYIYIISLFLPVKAAHSMSVELKKK